MSKKILTFATLLFLITSLGIFVIGSQAEAISQCPINECPPNKKSGTESEYIKMQIPIPGVTNSCTYDLTYQGKAVSKDGKKVTKTCHYVSANLPLYIKNIYKISIGIIAIIAVVTIMVAGLQWIFAAGNPTTIGNAKSQITAAVSGLILVLCSYVILYTINPSLVELRMQPIKGLKPIEQGTQWCTDYPEYYKQNVPYYFFEEGHFPDKSASYFKTRGNLTNCYKNYVVAYEEPVGSSGFVKVSGDKTCAGSLCANRDEACIGELGYTYCILPEKVCTKIEKNDCESLNKIIEKNNYNPRILSNSCYKRVDTWVKVWEAGDECVWDKIIFCPNGWERVDCFSAGAQDICWKLDGAKQVSKDVYESSGEKKFCTDSPYSNEEASAICCKKENANEFKIAGYIIPVPPNQIESVSVDCTKVDSCSNYQVKDACQRDICKLKAICEWQGSRCIEK